MTNEKLGKITYFDFFFANYILISSNGKETIYITICFVVFIMAFIGYLVKFYCGYSVPVLDPRGTWLIILT